MNKNVIEIKAVSLADLLAKGLEIAFIEGNRELVNKNVANKKHSYEEFGCNIIPILYVAGEKAVADGCQLLDGNGNAIAPEDAAKFVAIVDGQHRYEAAIQNGLPPEDLILLEDYSGAPTQNLIASSNCDSFTWNTKDYVNGAVLMNPESAIAKFAKGLVNRGFSISTLGLILFFEGGKLTKKDFALIMEGKDIRNTKDCDLGRAKAFLEASKGFEDKFLAKRYLIEAVINLSKEDGYKVVLQALSQLSEQEITRIQTAKSEKAKEVAIVVLTKHLAEKQAA